MTQLDELIDFLGSFTGPVATGGSTSCASVIADLTHERDSFVASILSSVRESLSDSYEANNYYEIVTHLLDILSLKLKYDDRSFLEISGIRLNKNTCELEVVAPDLSSLGTHSDWLAMQEAGRNLFQTTRAGDPAAGWRGYYIAYVSDKGPKADIYPAIMRARLSWGKSNALAPYWYWYDKAVASSDAYPNQSSVDFSSEIASLARQLVAKINRYSSKGTISVSVNTDNISYLVEDMLEEVFTGRPPARRVIIEVDYVGTYGGAKKTQPEVKRLLDNNSIKEGKAFQRGNKIVVQLHDVSTGRFTGLRREIENK